MKLLLHHFLKSVRSLRWILGLWLLIVAIQTVVIVFSVQPDYQLARVAEKIGPSPLWSMLTAVTWTIVIVRLIQSEPVTGATSFWLTRPIPPFISVLSKSIFILGFVILLSLVPKAIDLSLFAVPSAAVQDSLEGIVFLELIMALCVVWLATYTRNIGQFAGAIGVLFVLFTTYSITTAFESRSFVSTPDWHPELLASRFDLSFLIFMGGLVTSLFIQNFFRSTRKAFLLGLGCILLSFLILNWWPFVLPSLWNQSHPAANPKPLSLSYQLDSTKPFSWGATQLGDANYQTARVPLLPPTPTAKGIPFIHTINSTFQPNGNEKITLPSSLEAYHDSNLDWLPQLRQDNSGLVIAGTAISTNEPAPAFMLNPELTAKLRDQKGILDLKIGGDIVALQKRAEIPLGGNGFARIPQALIRVIAMQKEKSSLELSVEEVGYRDLMKWPAFPTVYLLVDPRNHLGIVPKKMPMGSARNNFSGALSRMSAQISLQVQLNDLPEGMRANFQDRAANGLVLYVYEVTSSDSFESDVKISDYTFHPGER